MQKNQILIALFIFVFTVGCFAGVTRTLTIDNSMLDQIRSSLDPTSSNYDAILHYAQLRGSDEYIPDNYTPPPTPPPIPKPSYYYKISDSVSKLKSAMFASVAQTQNDKLHEIEDLLNTISLSSFLDGYYTNENVDGPRRALDLIYLTVNAAMLYDCLYYESTVSPTSKDALKQTLEYCITLIEETECYFYELAGNPVTNGRAYWQSGYEGSSHSDYPAFILYQYRFAMYASLGLASILLYQSAVLEENTLEAQSMLNWVNFVDGKLRNEMLPVVFPLSSQSDSMIDFHTTKSGAYMECPSYLIQLLGEIVPYFLARKRIDTADLPSYNYFNDPRLISWVNDITAKIVPSLDEWPYNDTRYAGSSSSHFNPGPAVFYYNSNSASSTVMDNLSWYYQVKNSWLIRGFITGGEVISNNFQVIYASNPGIPVADMILNRSIANPIPAYGSISNTEFTILREQTSTNVTEATDGLINKPTMYVVHESSFSGGHGHADQASFIFYNKGQYFLIDPGYFPYDPFYKRKWSLSPYGHNMVIVKPDTDREIRTLAGDSDDLEVYNSYQYQPRGAFRYYNRTSVSESMIVEDPCIKDYFQKSNDLDILRLKLTYDDTNFPSDHPELALPIADLDRTFIRDNDIFVVYDNVQTRLNCGPYEAWNLLHFGTNTAITPVDNTYALTVGSETIDLVCGTPNQQNSTLCENDLYPNTSELPYGQHKRSKTVVSSSSNPIFLNVILPRSGTSGTSRVEQVLTTTGKFATKVRSWSSTDPASECRTYIGGQTSASTNFAFSGRTI